MPSQPRAAAYVRVSSEEQVEGFSLDAQERAIRDYCNAHGYEIVTVYRDEGISARTDDVNKRPAFKQMLLDGEARRFEILIVHKLDRFARNRRVAFDAYERLGRAGVGFISVSENIDYSSAQGQLMLTMFVGLSQFYSDNLSNETKKGKRERKAQGLYNGVLPFGAKKGEDGVPIADPVTHSGLVFAFEMAAGGKTDREVARALNEAGYRTTGNRGANPFTKDTVREFLQNRFYLGELPDGTGGWLPAKHEALIDPAVFAAAKLARERNTSRPLRVAGPGKPWALSGLAVCSCGASFVANGAHHGKRALRCAGRAQGSGCDEPSFHEDVLDEQLMSGILARFAVDEGEQERLIAAWLRHQGQVGNATQARASVERKLARLQEIYLDGDLDRQEYQKRRARLLQEREALPTDIVDSERVARRLASFLASLPAAWAVATPEERNRLARQLFAEAIIENRTVVAVKPRPELLPFFAGVNSCEGGSDGGRLREIDVVDLPLVPILYPERLLHSHRRSGIGRYAPVSKGPSIGRDHWCDVAVRAERDGLRSTARHFGVSHETVRSICKRVKHEAEPAEDSAASLALPHFG